MADCLQSEIAENDEKFFSTTKRKFFYDDSLTTQKSIAFRLAQEMGIPSAYRDIFLDSINDENNIKKKMIELFYQAQEKGQSIGICHPFDKTLRVLKENIHLAEEYNLELVFASRIVQ